MARIEKHFVLLIVLVSPISLRHVLSSESTNELFFPYGKDFDDTVLANVDDDSSPEVSLTHQFPYFDNLYSSLFVSTNGVISFIQPIRQYTPEPFPLSNGRCILAPFWTDVDTTRSDFGVVFYRESQDADLLDQLTKEIQDVFVDQHRFKAIWAFISTWDNVTFYGGGPTTPINTFQAVLTTNGRHSFAIFNYGKITWTTGINNQSGGDNNGLGGVPAQAGFNAGDGYRYYSIPGSLKPSIVDIENTSNIGKPGRWIFRIDDNSIQSGGCNTQGSISLYPKSGTMLGGSEVLVGGPCFKYTDTIKCRFDGIDSPGYYINEYRIKCITPLLNITGRIAFELSLDGETYPFTGFFHSISPLDDSSPPDVIRDLPNSWHTSFGPYTVRWQTSKLQTNCINLDLLGYWQATTGVRNILIPLIKDQPNSGEVTFQPTVNLKYPLVVVGALRLTECDGNFHREFKQLWSSLHDLKWYALKYLEQEAIDIALNMDNNIQMKTNSKELNETMKIQLHHYTVPIIHKFKTKIDNLIDNKKISDLNHFIITLVYDSWNIYKKSYYNDICEFWVKSETNLPYKSFKENLPPCPCNLAQALRDSGTFEADHACNMKTAPKCTWHLGAIHCVRSILPSLDGACQQCCYDSEGKILNVLDTAGGGTLDRSHNEGYRGFINNKMIEKIPVIDHYVDDVFPYQICCQWSDNCPKYFNLRPSDDCSTYIPPRPAAGFGDPHITMLDGFEYTFNGIGEFILVRVSNYLEIQGRATQVININGTTVKATVWSAIAIQYEYSSTLQVELNKRRGLDVYANGILINFETIQKYQNNNLTVSQNITNGDVMISLQNGVYVEVNAHNELLNFLILLPAIYKDKTEGLLGRWNDNPEDDLQLPNGTIIPPTSSAKTLYYQFGTQWRTKPEESIFTYHYGTNHSLYQDENFEPEFIAPAPSDPSIEALCGGSEQCLYDFSVTGNINIALVSMMAAGAVKRFAEDIKTVVSCGIPDIPKHSIKVGKHYMFGNTINFECKNGYKEMTTETSIVCQEDGTWTRNNIICIEVNCSKPDAPIDGLVIVKSVTVGATLEYACNIDYYLEGDKKRTCLHTGYWSGESPLCLKTTSTISMGFLAGILGGIGATIILIGLISFCYRLNLNQETRSYQQDSIPLMHSKKKEDSPSRHR